MHKYEVQSAHFNKRSYSLHCTVEHVNPIMYPHLKSPYIYHYHLSNEMKHDYAYTSIVANDCLQGKELPMIIRRKSDNCSTQYKCQKVFGEYQRLAQKYDRTVIIYYGPSGHGKGLVDAMSAFGVKTPIRRAVLTKDFKYASSRDICIELKEQFCDDPQKLYSVIEPERIMALRQECKPIPIAGCVKNCYHMISFHPDGSILSKVNLCSCTACLEGNFLNCLIKKGNLHCGVNGEYGSDESDSDVEYEDDDEFGDEIIDDSAER